MKIPASWQKKLVETEDYLLRTLERNEYLEEQYEKLAEENKQLAKIVYKMKRAMNID